MSKTTIPTGGLADAAVTTAKITDANITTAKIADDAVTSAKATGIGISVCFSASVIFAQLQNQKEMVATKEYIALKYATLEESDTLLQMKLKAHRATLAEDGRAHV